MTNIDTSINKLKQKGNNFFASKKENSLKQIDKTINSFSEYAKKTNSFFAFMDLEKLQNFENKKTDILPELVKIGNLSALNINKNKINKAISLLLPFTKNNATIFFLDGNNSKLIHNLFQNIALRFMLTIAPNLTRYHFIDINFGGDFSVLNNIKNNIINKKVIAKQSDISQTINEFGDKIISANQDFLAKSPNIIEYNKTAGSMANPYDFVFIAINSETQRNYLIYK